MLNNSGLSKDAEFRRLLRKIKARLPDQVKQEIEKRADKIRNVEDLAAVVNSLYSKFGTTLESSFMLFTFAGKTHLMVRLNDASFKKVRDLMQQCYDSGKDINEEMERRLVG